MSTSTPRTGRPRGRRTGRKPRQKSRDVAQVSTTINPSAEFEGNLENSPSSARKTGLSEPLEPSVDAIVAFIQSLPVNSGLLAGQKMTVWSWQREILEGIYGGERPVREAVISVGRKNGKTAFAAALAVAHLLGPLSEPGGEVVCAASDIKQASILFNHALWYVESKSKWRNDCKVYARDRLIQHKPSRSTLHVVSSDARRQHGLSASFVIADEVAQWSKRDLYEALQTSGGARRNPLMLTISTQSADPNSLMSELVDYALSVEGKADPKFYGYVRSAADGCELDDRVEWGRANPGLGEIRSVEELEEAVRKAQQIPARESSVRNLYLNQRVQADATFLPVSEWLACEGVPDRRGRCYIGLDLASVNDLAAIAAYWPDTGAVDAWHWAGPKAREQIGRLPLDVWESEGMLHIGSGGIQKSDVARKLGELVEQYEVEAVVYDRWAIQEFTQAAEREGIILPEMFPWGQGYRSMSPAIDEFERLVLERGLVHANPMLTWQFQNIVIESDTAGNRKFTKSKAVDKIDGVLALVMAVGRAAKSVEYEYDFSEAVIRL